MQAARAKAGEAAERANQYLNKTATAFFTTANDSYKLTREAQKPQSLPNVLSNAIIALHTAMNNMQKDVRTIKRTDSMRTVLKKTFGGYEDVARTVENVLEKAAENNEKLKSQMFRFSKNFFQAHPKTAEDRILLARLNCVRADGVHKPTFWERFFAKLNKSMDVE